MIGTGPSRLRASLISLLTSPKYLGRTVLESVLRLDKEKISESTCLIVGWGILLAVILIAFGVIRFEQIMNVVDRLRGTAK